MKKSNTRCAKISGLSGVASSKDVNSKHIKI